MVSHDIDPLGLTWRKANSDSPSRDIYDSLLCKHGYNPISKKGTTSSIHGSQDWTIPLRLKVSHSRDIQGMKWKLYIYCLHKCFSKIEFVQLEQFASTTLDPESKLLFDKIDMSSFPFPEQIQTSAFAANLAVLMHLHKKPDTPSLNSSVCREPQEQPKEENPLFDETLFNAKRIKNHNRVLNGDLTALQIDYNGKYALGDEK